MLSLFIIHQFNQTLKISVHEFNLSFPTREQNIRQDFAAHYNKISADNSIETVISTIHLSSVIVEGIVGDAFSED